MSAICLFVFCFNIYSCEVSYPIQLKRHWDILRWFSTQLKTRSPRQLMWKLKKLCKNLKVTPSPSDHVLTITSKVHIEFSCNLVEMLIIMSNTHKYPLVSTSVRHKKKYWSYIFGRIALATPVYRLAMSVRQLFSLKFLDKQNLGH